MSTSGNFNKMAATIVFDQGDAKDLSGYITAKAKGNQVLPGYIEYNQAEGNAYLEGDISVVVSGEDYLKGSLGIRPTNRMVANIPVIPPPVVEIKNRIEKDAGCYSLFERINFGDYKTGLFGKRKSDTEDYVFFIGVKTEEEVTQEGIDNLARAKLKLKASSALTATSTYEVRAVTEEWEEGIIKYYNMPTIEDCPLIKTITIDAKQTDIEIDLYDYVKDHIQLGYNSFSFVIVPTAGAGLLTVHTKEADNEEDRPVFSLGYTHYYDNIGLHDLEGSLVAIQTGNAYLKGSIYLLNGKSSKDLSGELEIIGYGSEGTLGGEIEVKQINVLDLEGNIFINRYDANIEIQGQINVIVPGHQDLSGELEIIGYDDSKDIAGQIAIAAMGTADYDGYVSINTLDGDTFIPGQIAIRETHYKDLEGQVAVKQEEHKDLSGDVKVFNQKDMEGQITVVQSSHHDISGTITTLTPGAHDMEGSINVHIVHDIPGSIKVLQSGGSYAFIL